MTFRIGRIVQGKISHTPYFSNKIAIVIVLRSKRVNLNSFTSPDVNIDLCAISSRSMFFQWNMCRNKLDSNDRHTFNYDFFKGQIYMTEKYFFTGELSKNG